jgi:hypothetical protein
MSKSFAHSSESVEWFTPFEYIESARKVMGSIDLDPASCKLANELCVEAKSYFTEDLNGLHQNWWGNVFCNPPYGRGENNRSNQDIWSNKLINEYKSGRIDQAILLVNAVPDRKWFSRLWDYHICFVKSRIKFIDNNGEQQKSPPHPSVFVYFGDNVLEFCIEFSKHGHIVGPIDVIAFNRLHKSFSNCR